MTERTYRAVKRLRHDGKFYEIGDEVILAAETGDSLKGLVLVDAVAGEAAEVAQPDVVPTPQVVMISITGASDADTLAVIDALLAAGQPLDVRVTLDEIAARTIAALAPAAVPEITSATDGAFVHVDADKPLTPETEAALNAAATLAATALVSDATTAPSTGGTEPAPTVAEAVAAVADKPKATRKGKPAKAADTE